MVLYPQLLRPIAATMATAKLFAIFILLVLLSFVILDVYGFAAPDFRLGEIFRLCENSNIVIFRICWAQRRRIVISFTAPVRLRKASPPAFRSPKKRGVVRQMGTQTKIQISKIHFLSGVLAVAYFAANSFFTQSEMALPSARPASSLLAVPMTLPMSFMLVAPTFSMTAATAASSSSALISAGR